MDVDPQPSDLEPASGPTPNDKGDSDTGANHLQNYPELYVGNMRGVKGFLDTSNQGPCLIEFFSSAGPGGQGEKSLGIVLHIPRPGEDLFYYSFSDPADKHHSELHATATAMDGSTSELSPGLPIKPPGTFR